MMDIQTELGIHDRDAEITKLRSALEWVMNYLEEYENYSETEVYTIVRSALGYK